MVKIIKQQIHCIWGIGVRSMGPVAILDILLDGNTRKGVKEEKKTE